MEKKENAKAIRDYYEIQISLAKECLKDVQKELADDLRRAADETERGWSIDGMMSNINYKMLLIKQYQTEIREKKSALEDISSFGIAD